MNFKNSFTHILSRCAFWLALAAFPLQASAENIIPDNDSNEISNPGYLVPEGRIQSTSHYAYGSIDSRTYNSQGAWRSSNHTATNMLDETLAYGVTHNFTVRINDGYGWNRASSNPLVGANSDNDANGFKDPAIGATWRVLSQKDYPVSWDILAGYAPDVFDAKSASPTQDGTIARGGQTAGVGTALSYKIDYFTVYGSGSANYLGGRDLINQVNGINTNYDSGWQYILSLNTQTHLTEAFSFNLGVSETFTNSVTASYVSSGNFVSYTNEPGDVTALTTALNYEIIPDKLAAAVIYTHDFYSTSSMRYAATPASDTTLKDENGNTISAQVTVRFN